MLFYDGTRWRPYPYEISYTDEVKVFDTDVSQYKDKANLRAKVIELTDVQRCRLEVASKVTTLSLDSLISYVMDGIMQEKPSKELLDAIASYEQRQTLKGLLDMYTVPIGQLIKMDNLILKYETGAYYEAEDLVECDGVLYVVTEAHVASLEHPSMDQRLYVERR